MAEPSVRRVRGQAHAGRPSEILIEYAGPADPPNWRADRRIWIPPATTSAALLAALMREPLDLLAWSALADLCEEAEDYPGRDWARQVCRWAPWIYVSERTGPSDAQPDYFHFTPR